MRIIVRSMWKLIRLLFRYGGGFWLVVRSVLESILVFWFV